MSELAGRYGVSRESFYVWKRRRDSGDMEWFRDRAPIADSCPHRTDEDLVAAVVAMRRRFPRFGPKKYAGVRGELARLFGTVGLPQAIRSDNGVPFGSGGAGGLSRLSAWLLRLGVDVHFIPPGSPQDNGRHERMHRELKAETAREPSASATEQQARFDEFRTHYNQERPHEALDQTPPARHWQSSLRRLPDEVPMPWYDASHEVRTVRGHGGIQWCKRDIFISEALSGEQIGICELENGSHLVRFCHRKLGVIKPDLCFVRFAAPRAPLRSANET